MGKMRKGQMIHHPCLLLSIPFLLSENKYASSTDKNTITNPTFSLHLAGQRKNVRFVMVHQWRSFALPLLSFATRPSKPRSTTGRRDFLFASCTCLPPLASKREMLLKRQHSSRLGAGWYSKSKQGACSERHNACLAGQSDQHEYERSISCALGWFVRPLTQCGCFGRRILFYDSYLKKKCYRGWQR